MHIPFGDGRAARFVPFDKVVSIAGLGLQDANDFLQFFLQELSPQDRQRVLNNVDLQWELFSRMMAGFRSYTSKRAHLVNEIFNPASAQLESIEKLNTRLRLGIRPRAFAQAAKHIPTWPNTSRVGLVLVPYLPDAGRRSGPERTIRALIHALRPVLDDHPAHVKRLLDDCMQRGLVTTAPHEQGLRWEIIDYGYVPDRGTYGEVLSGESYEPAHAGVLAALALHPGYLRAIQTHPEIQYPVMGGYHLKARPDDFRDGEYMLLSFPAVHWNEGTKVHMDCSSRRDVAGQINKPAVPIILGTSKYFV